MVKDELDLFFEGFALFNQGSYKESLVLFEKILEDNPNFEEAIGYKAFALSEVESAEYALKYVNYEINRLKNNYELDYVKSALLNELKRYHESIYYYKPIFNNEKDFVCPFQADNYFAIKDYENALLYFTGYLHCSPKNSKIWYKLGCCFFYLSDFEFAIECLDMAIELNPKCSFAYACKGKCLERITEYSGAIDCFKKAYELNSDKTDYLVSIKRCLKVLGRIKEARKYENMIDNLPSPMIFHEEELTHKIYNNPSVLKKFGYEVENIEQQYTIRDKEGMTRFIDLIFNDKKTDQMFIIEVRAVKATFRTFNQINLYLQSLKDNYNIICKGIVIARGYESNFMNMIKEREDLDFIELQDLEFE